MFQSYTLQKILFINFRKILALLRTPKLYPNFNFSRIERQREKTIKALAHTNWSKKLPYLLVQAWSERINEIEFSSTLRIWKQLVSGF